MLSISKETKTKEGNIYSVFTPFKNAVWKEFCTKKVLPKVDMTGVSFFTQDLNHIVKIIPSAEDSIKSVLSIKKTFAIEKKIFDVESLLNVETKYDE
jgi:deoxyribodipyrimidine photolyase